MRQQKLRKALVCLGLFGYCLYSLIEHQNHLIRTELKLYPLHETIRGLEEETAQLAWTIKEFESPANLYEALAKAEYGHLKAPESAYVVARVPKRSSAEAPKQEGMIPSRITAIGAAAQRP